MSVQISKEAIDRIAAIAQVKEAAHAAHDLIELWPLTDAQQLDNDAKYAENLQVRITHVIAKIVSGADVTRADAEFVYEGADEIPGRPQLVVDALLNANDAYDSMAEYSQTGDADLLIDAAHALQLDWSQDFEDTMTGIASDIDAIIAPHAVAGAHLEPSADEADIARRFAFVIITLNLMLRAASDLIDGTQPQTLEHRVHEHPIEILRLMTPVLLLANELCERLALPRVYANEEQLEAMMRAFDTAAHEPDEAQADINDSAVTIADVLGPRALSEWRKHREDVLWDAAAAKKRAREEDERKNKEALAAKFAHVKDDPNKEEVEL